MAVVWKRNAFSALTGYRITLENAQKAQLRLDGAPGAQLPDMTGKPHALYRLGQWMAEIFMPEGASARMELTLFRAAPASGQIGFSFGRNADALTITFLGTTPETKRFRNVSRVEIAPDGIRVEGEEISAAPEAGSAHADKTPREGVRVGTEPGRESAETRRMREELLRKEAALAAAEEKLSRTQEELSETKEALSRKERELSRTQAELSKAERKPPQADGTLANTERELARSREALAKAEQNLDSERRFNARLQIIANTRLEEVLENLKRDKERLDRDLKEKLSEAERLSGQARDTKRAISDKEAEAERLNRELKDSGALLELKTLDCEKARQTLDTLRERHLSDADTLELMRAEPFLKGNSVRKTLEAVGRELEAAENKLGLIIRLREKINDAVQMAILAGDGTLPLSEELGGRRHGGGGPASGESPKDGAGFERGREPAGASAPGD